MKSLILRCCVVVGFGLLAISAANGQTQAIGPQPDIASDAAAAPSPAQIIAEFDLDKDRQLDQQELKNVLRLLFRQIQSLQREVHELKSQMAKESAQTPKLHVTKKVPLGPTDGGVYAGKYYPPSSDK